MMPVNQLEKDQDEDGKSRQYVHQLLKCYYPFLYQNIDYWIMLKVPSFDCVYQWRLEQEFKLASNTITSDNQIMFAKRLRKFIQHFERLTEECLVSVPRFSDCTFLLNGKRSISQVIGK